jgi:serine/threonine-protein kinase
MDVRGKVPGYRVLKPVGSGAVATIYLAEGPKGERVALKVVSGDRPGGSKACDELNREYKILSKLEHPGIPRAYGLQRVNGGLVMIRDFCSGTSLRNLMRSEPGRVSRMIPDILERSGGMLQHMHDRGIVHRDFKPENLIVDEEGEVFLVDMALAWRRRLLLGKPSLAGTPAYLAPELLGGKPPSPASDTYSYAATAYELLSGRPPYQGNSREQVLIALRRGGAPPPSVRNKSVPPDVNRLVMQGLNRDPKERPKNLLYYGGQLAGAIRDTGIGPAPK